MAEVVDEMPSGRESTNDQVYPWSDWLDGRVWRLTQGVVLQAVLDEATGAVLVPEQVVEGDFNVPLEKMRTYARNAGNRRSPKQDLRTRSETETIEVVRVAGEPPVKAKRKVLYIQAIPKMEREKAATPAPASVTVTDEQLQIDLEAVEAEGGTLDPGAVEAAQAEVQAEMAGMTESLAGLHPLPGHSFIPGAAPAGLPEGVEPVRQGDIEQPEPEAAPDEWVEIPVEEDPQDPYAPPVPGEWPETDRPSAVEEGQEPVGEVAQ